MSLHVTASRAPVRVHPAGLVRVCPVLAEAAEIVRRGRQSNELWLRSRKTLRSQTTEPSLSGGYEDLVDVPLQELTARTVGTPVRQ